MKYFVIFFILIGFVGTAFAENTSNDIDSIPEQDCGRPICFIEDENKEKPSRGSDFIIKVQVEPQTKFTVRVFDLDMKLIFKESTFSDKNGIARLVYPIPHEAKDGSYEITVTSYASKGAIHTGMLLQIGERFSPPYDRPHRIIHAHMEHDDGHYTPLVVDKQINMRLITNYKFENNTGLPLEFTIFDPDGKILEQGIVVNEKGNTARHYFTAKTDGLHKVVAKSDTEGFPEHSEKFGVLKSQYIIHENDREYPVLVSPMDEPTIAINNMKFDGKERQITFEMEPTWAVQDRLMVELPYGLLDGPYRVFVDGQLQDLESDAGFSGRVFFRGDLTVLAIPLEYNSTKVEIIGTTVFPETSEELTLNSKELEYRAEQIMTIHGTSLPKEALTVKVYKSDNSIVFSDEFVSGPHGTFEHDIFAWPKHSLDFPDGRYTVEVSSAENLKRLEAINIKFQNRYDFFSGFQQIPIQHQLKNFEFLPTKIACKEELILVIKERDNSPACVFPATAQKISQRGGWNIIEHRILVNWLDSEYKVNGTGTIQVVDSRTNMSSETVESLVVYVWSDSDPDGIELRLTETGPNTGTFEGTLYFSENVESSENRLFVSAGDLVQAFHKNMVDDVLITRN